MGTQNVYGQSGRIIRVPYKFNVQYKFTFECFQAMKKRSQEQTTKTIINHISGVRSMRKEILW